MPFDSCDHEQKHTVDYLVGAVEEVRNPDHWCQGSFNIGDKWCILGAVAHQVIGRDARLIADYQDFRARMRRGTLGSQMRECVSILYQSLPFWSRVRRRLSGRTYAEAITRFNDREATTHNDVLRLMRTAIRRAGAHVVI